MTTKVSNLSRARVFLWCLPCGKKRFHYMTRAKYWFDVDPPDDNSALVFDFSTKMWTHKLLGRLAEDSIRWECSVTCSICGLETERHYDD